MPDYNPAVALGVQSGGPNLNQTLSTITNLQHSQAATGLVQLQALAQQRDYMALQAYSQATQAGENGLEAAARVGPSGAMLNQLQTYESNRAAMKLGGGTMPQNVEAAAGIAQKQAETANVRAQIPGTLAKSETSIREGAASLANQYGTDPTPQNWQAMRNYTARYQGEDAAKQLDAITDPQARLARATGHVGGGLTAEQGAATVQTQNAQGAPVYQTRSQFLSGQPQTGQTPAAKSEQEKFGATLGEVLPKLQDDANAAKQMNFTLGQMKDESKNFTMGAYAPGLTTFAKYLKPLANSVGDNRFDNWVGSNEDFAKNAGVLARQGVKEISNRPSQFEFQAVSGQMPHDAMSQQGFEGIVDQFQAVNDFKQSKAFAAQKWQAAKGTMSGFEADWNSHVGPAAFLVANMKPEQQAALKAKLSPATLKSITTQLKWAHDNNLEQGLF